MCLYIQLSLLRMSIFTGMYWRHNDLKANYVSDNTEFESNLNIQCHCHVVHTQSDNECITSEIHYKIPWLLQPMLSQLHACSLNVWQ